MTCRGSDLAASRSKGTYSETHPRHDFPRTAMVLRPVAFRCEQRIPNPRAVVDCPGAKSALPIGSLALHQVSEHGTITFVYKRLRNDRMNPSAVELANLTSSLLEVTRREFVARTVGGAAALSAAWEMLSAPAVQAAGAPPPCWRAPSREIHSSWSGNSAREERQP